MLLLRRRYLWRRLEEMYEVKADRSLLLIATVRVRMKRASQHIPSTSTAQTHCTDKLSTVPYLHHANSTPSSDSHNSPTSSIA